MSQETSERLNILRTTGTVQFCSENSLKAATHLQQKYLDPFYNSIKTKIENPEPFILVSPESGRIAGDLLEGNISFRDSVIQKFIFDPEFVALFYNYFGRQPHYSRHPRLNSIEGDEYYNPAAEWHTHYYHPVVVQLLVTDLEPKTTHLEVVKGTHAERWWETGITTSGGYAEQRIHSKIKNKCQKLSNEEIFIGSGKQGTVNVFDSRAYHRMHILEGVRNLFILQVTTGHSIKPFYGTCYPYSKQNHIKLKKDCLDAQADLKKDHPSYGWKTLSSLSSKLNSDKANDRKWRASKDELGKLLDQEKRLGKQEKIADKDFLLLK